MKNVLDYGGRLEKSHGKNMQTPSKSASWDFWTRAFSLWGTDHYATAVIIYNMLKTSSVWDDIKTVMINQLSKNWKESKSKKKQTWHLLILQLEL